MYPDVRIRTIAHAHANARMHAHTFILDVYVRQIQVEYQSNIFVIPNSIGKVSFKCAIKTFLSPFFVIYVPLSLFLHTHSGAAFVIY